MPEKRGTGPGGPHVSSAKKRRLAELKNSLMDKHSDNPPTGFLKEAKMISRSKQQTSSFPYAELPDDLIAGSMSRDLKPWEEREAGGEGSQNGPLHHFVEELLSTNRSQTADARALAASRVTDKTIHLDNPAKRVGAYEQAGLVSSKPAGYCLKLARRLPGTHRSIVDALKDPHSRGKSLVSYESLKPLNTMWLSYMTGLTSSGGEAGPVLPDGRLLSQADLHGCQISVLDCSDVRHSGVEGIVAAVTRNVVCLVTEEDRLHVVLKKGTRFRFKVPPGHTVTVDGDSLIKSKLFNS